MKKNTTLGIIGLGRMGQSIQARLERRNDLAYKLISRLSSDQIPSLQACDVAIEFTTSEAAPEVIRTCLDLGVPIVSGTTGWHEYHLEEIIWYGKQKKGKFLYASNFSIGMNIVFALNRKLAGILSAYPDFRPAIKEIHHVQKKDMPSGTAFTLLEGIMKQRPEYTDMNLNANRPYAPHDIPVEAIREGDVKGIHEVTWDSGHEKISFGHEAFDRGIFASGAIMASLWLDQQPPGIYTMRDILDF